MTENILAYPRLGEVMMVEDAITGSSGSFRRRQMWKHLPQRIAHRKFCLTADYLLETNKIAADRKGKIAWIWDPELVKKYLSRKDLMWKRE